MRAPRAASGAASTSTMAAERASWIPPANRTESSSAALVLEEARELLLPEQEARARADVAAALAALEDEAPGALLQEEVEQRRRGHVQVGRDADLLERARLRRTPAGDERHGRADVVHDRELLLAELGRDEAEDAHAPRPAAQALGRLVEQPPHLRAAEQREGEEREPASVRDGLGERRRVADARHRALRDRVADPVRLRERAARPQRARCACGGGVLAHRAADGADDARHGVGQRGRESCVLPGRDDIRLEGVGAQLGRDSPLGGRQVGPRVDAVAVDDARLAAVHGRHGRPYVRRQGRLADERELGVEHDAARAGGDRGRSAVRPEAALRPDGHLDGVDEPLEEHERPLLADPAAGLGALGDDAVGACRGGRAGLLHARHLHEHGARAPGLDGQAGVEDDEADERPAVRPARRRPRRGARPRRPWRRAARAPRGPRARARARARDRARRPRPHGRTRQRGSRRGARTGSAPGSGCLGPWSESHCAPCGGE